MTDDRLGGAKADDPLWGAIARLPRGAGIVFRHYGLPKAERSALQKRISAIARRRGLVVVGSRIGGAPDGVHRPAHRPGFGRLGRGIVTASAHGRRELVQAFRYGADMVFLSPVFPTRSHPRARVLGPARFGLAALGSPGPVVALGGMDVARARRMRALGSAGFAGIDCWTRDQPGISSARC